MCVSVCHARAPLPLNNPSTTARVDDKQLQQDLPRLAPCDLAAVHAAMARCTQGIDAHVTAVARPVPAQPVQAADVDDALRALSDAVDRAMAQGAAIFEENEKSRLKPADARKGSVPPGAMPSFRLPVRQVLAGALDASSMDQEETDRDAPRSVVMQHLLSMPAEQLAAMFEEVQLRTVLLYVQGLQECVEELAMRVQELSAAMVTARCL